MACNSHDSMAEDHRVELSTREGTDSFRLIHGAADGHPGHFVELLGDWLLWECDEPGEQSVPGFVRKLVDRHNISGVYAKHRSRHVRGHAVEDTSPRLIWGKPAPDRFAIRENGVSFELSFAEGYSYGLFLDQRENRRRFVERSTSDRLFGQRTSSEAPKLLNTFAYTCGFSVAAAKAGFATTSLDLSRKYLDWGRRNFELNGLDLSGQDFIYGDTFDWCRRLARKGRCFDVIILDPPTFSKSKQSGVFRAEKDYGDLVRGVLPMLSKDGVLLASTNASRLSRHEFVSAVVDAIHAVGRDVAEQEFVGQPPDFPSSPDEPPYLKTVWMRVN